MLSGGSAKKAVEVACQLDPNSGRPVTEMRIQLGKRKR